MPIAPGEADRWPVLPRRAQSPHLSVIEGLEVRALPASVGLIIGGKGAA
jgi:hypothetical protein